MSLGPSKVAGNMLDFAAGLAGELLTHALDLGGGL